MSLCSRSHYWFQRQWLLPRNVMVYPIPEPRAQSNALALASISEFTQLLSCTSRAINILSNMCLILNMQESVSLVSICLKLQTMSYKKVLNTFVIFIYLISAICFCWGNTGNEVFHTFLWSFDCLAPTIRPAANHRPQIVLLILLTYTYPFCLFCNYISADSTPSFICFEQYGSWIHGCVWRWENDAFHSQYPMGFGYSTTGGYCTLWRQWCLYGHGKCTETNHTNKTYGH